MKKVISLVLLLLAIAAGILCFIFPTQARDVYNNVLAFLNTPIAIAGISTTIGGIVAFILVKFIMTNSKFGRKELDNVKQEFEQLQDASIKHQQALTMKISEYEDNFNELKNNCNNQITVMLDQFEDLQSGVINALKSIPNKKVQAIVAQYEAEYDVKKQEIITKTINTNEYVDEKIAEMKKQFEEFMERISNERKETVDNQTEEEQE